MLAAACSVDRILLVTQLMSTVDVFCLFFCTGKINDLELELELSKIKVCYDLD